MTTKDRCYTHLDLPPLLRNAAALTVRSPSVEATTQSMLHDGDARIAVEDGVSQDAFFDQIHLDEALEIYATVRSLRPENTLEIGFCCGGSGLAILKALEDNGVGMHHAVDPYQSSYADNLGRRHVRTAGLDHRLRFYESFPERVFPELPRVQFAFIDASHLFDLSMLDFVLVDKLLDVNGVVALHDMWMPALRKLVRFVLLNRGYEIISSSRPKSPPTLKSRANHLFRRLLGLLPRAGHIFSPEFLKPWHFYGLSNLAFLRKVAEDQRDWRAFQDF
jgi:predicted O-methyltransferase YrrM